LDFLAEGFSSVFDSIFRRLGSSAFWNPMKTPKQRCKCLHCNEYFVPNYRSGERQRFCLKPECRKVRRQQNQKAWLAKPENQNHFRDDENAARVREWQQAHPGYWKNTTRYRRRTLQVGCSEQVTDNKQCPSDSPKRTLQDLCSLQIPLFVGLISMLAGSTLPNEIAMTTRCLVANGHNILGMVPGMNPERSLHEKTCPQSGTTPESAGPVQLDRSSVSPGKLLPPL
jgi:hypothetical protein